jgi:hypothetical protein
LTLLILVGVWWHQKSGSLPVLKNTLPVHPSLLDTPAPKAAELSASQTTLFNLLINNNLSQTATHFILFLILLCIGQKQGVRYSGLLTLLLIIVFLFQAFVPFHVLSWIS